VEVLFRICDADANGRINYKDFVARVMEADALNKKLLAASAPEPGDIVRGGGGV
jgi:hypothetical protein